MKIPHDFMAQPLRRPMATRKKTGWRALLARLVQKLREVPEW